MISQKVQVILDDMVGGLCALNKHVISLKIALNLDV